MMLENIDQTLKKCFEFDLKMIFLTQLSFRSSYDVVYSYFRVQRWQKNKFLNSKESLAKNKSNCQKIYPKNNMSSIIFFKENKWPMCISQLIKKKKKNKNSIQAWASFDRADLAFVGLEHLASHFSIQLLFFFPE